MYYAELQVASENLVIVLELSKDREVLTYSKPFLTIPPSVLVVVRHQPRL